MIPYNQTFSRMLKKYIPALTIEKINETDALLLRRDKLRKELYMIPKIYFLPKSAMKALAIEVREKYEKDYDIYNKRIPIIKNDIKKISRQVADKMTPYMQCLKAVHRLWMAQRRYAFEQGNLLQIPTHSQDWKRYIGAAFNYLKVQITTLPVLWFCKIRYYF